MNASATPTARDPCVRGIKGKRPRAVLVQRGSNRIRLRPICVSAPALGLYVAHGATVSLVRLLRVAFPSVVLGAMVLGGGE